MKGYRGMIAVCWVIFILSTIGTIWFDVWWPITMVLSIITGCMTIGYYSGLFCRLGMHDLKHEVLPQNLNDFGLLTVTRSTCLKCGKKYTSV